MVFDELLESVFWRGAGFINDIHTTSACALLCLATMLSYSFWKTANGRLQVLGQVVRIVARIIRKEEAEVLFHFTNPELSSNTLSPLEGKVLDKVTSFPVEGVENLRESFDILRGNMKIWEKKIFMLAITTRGKSLGHCVPCLAMTDYIFCGCKGEEFQGVSHLTAFVLRGEETFENYFDLMQNPMTCLN